VWTGHELIVWGGNFNGQAVPAEGAAYDPGTNRWRAIAAAPISTRENPMIVWTGHEMIVWGGLSNGKATAADRVESAAYDPVTDSWRVLPTSGLPAIELAPAAWTGSEFVVFGAPVGADASGDVGAAYNPSTNHWRDIATSLLSRREQMAYTWTGRELVVWGGIAFGGGRQTRDDGAAYDPTTDSWRALADAPLESRWGSTMAWTDGLVIVAGGYGPSAAALSSEPPATGAAAYRP
jgi:N-acetylneuraminic acid mutarotase